MILRIVLFFAAVGAVGQVLPDGTGKAPFQRICSTCHGLEISTLTKRSEAEWSEVMGNMVARGAEGTELEFAQVFQYLVGHFGKVNVNKAPAKELAAGLKLSPAEAESLAGYREKNGKFRNFNDILKVPGISAKKMEENRDRMEF